MTLKSLLVPLEIVSYLVKVVIVIDLGPVMGLILVPCITVFYFSSLCCVTLFLDILYIICVHICGISSVRNNYCTARHFSGWNDVIHVSITVQRHPSNFLFVKKRWNCLNVSTQDQIQGHGFSPSKEEKQHSNSTTSYVTSMIAVEPLSLSCLMIAWTRETLSSDRRHFNSTILLYSLSIEHSVPFNQ